jgi:hypothetical protein
MSEEFKLPEKLTETINQQRGKERVRVISYSVLGVSLLVQAPCTLFFVNNILHNQKRSTVAIFVTINLPHRPKRHHLQVFIV